MIAVKDHNIFANEAPHAHANKCSATRQKKIHNAYPNVAPPLTEKVFLSRLGLHMTS